MPRITTRSAKNKGARFQKQIAAEIGRLLDMPYGKDECIASRPMGCSSVDIILVGPARRLFPWSCEAKAQESFNVKSWIRQAETNILPGTQWLLLFKKNHFRPVVCFDYQVFSQLFGDRGLTTHTHQSKRWKIEEYIETARYESGTNWVIKLEYGDRHIALMEMQIFFDMLSNDEYRVKGITG